MPIACLVFTEQRNLAESILRAVGSTLWLSDEAQMDAVTALSGSGPAGQIVLAAVILSMALAPLLIRYNGALTKRFCALSYGQNRMRMEEQIGASTQGIKQHIIICRYGRVGQNIARVLEQEGFEFVALDLDPLRVREAQDASDAARRILRSGALCPGRTGKPDRAAAFLCPPEGAYAVGRTLEQLGLDKFEVVVTAVRRGGIRGPQPEPHTQLRAGDVLILYGAPHALERAEGALLKK